MKFNGLGIKVRYCGHDAWFIADAVRVAGAVVIRANGPIEKQLNRPGNQATHHLVDFPVGGYWNPAIGVFVVPQDQLREIK